MKPLPKDEVWDKLNELYGNLVKFASWKISGDIGASVEDYIQELNMVLIHAAESYLKKLKKDTGNEHTFEQVFESKELTSNLGKWVKTCIWNAKNTIGKKISLRRDFFNSMMTGQKETTHSIDSMVDGRINNPNFEILSHYEKTIPDPKSSNGVSEVLINSTLTDLPPLEAKIIKCIVDNDDVLLGNGTINTAAVAKIIGVEFYDAAKAITRIRHFMKKGML
jgi:hypothetical protein